MSDVLVGAGTELQNFGFLDLDVDIGATSIALFANSQIGGPGGLFGLSFADVDTTIPRIISVVIGAQSGFVGLLASDLVIEGDGNEIIVDFGNAVINQSDSLTLDVTFREPPAGVIPLPATLPLTLAGFAALAGFRRRRPA